MTALPDHAAPRAAAALLAAALLALALAPRASAQLDGHRPAHREQPQGRAGRSWSSTGRALTGLERQVDAIDPEISDGRGVVRVNATGIVAPRLPQERLRA